MVPKKRFEVVDELVVQFMEVQVMGIVILQNELLEISLCLHSSASKVLHFKAAFCYLKGKN